MKWYLDIETRVTRKEFPTATKALEEISLIQVVRDNDAVVFGTRELVRFKDFKFNEYNVNVNYVKCNDEVDMLNKFTDLIKSDNPEVIYAWNGNRFDFPYLYNRMKRLNLDVNRLSSSGSVTLTDKGEKYCGKLVTDVQKYADLMILYKCFGDTLKSYSLDSVSNHVLNESKVYHDEFEDFDSFYTGKNYKICGKYDDDVREEIRQLKIIESEGNLTEEQRKRMNDLIFFRYVFYGVKDSFLMKRIDEKAKITSNL